MGTSLRTLALVPASALTLAACAGDGGGDWAGTIADSAGVTVVNNPASANWTLRSQPRLTEELRIGAMDGAPELQFGQIAALDVDDDGAIYVLDTQAASVRVFDRDGRHLRSVGRAGGAPGEFSATTAAVLAGNDGVVYIADVMRQRIAALGPDGVEIGSTPLMMQEGIPVRWEITPERRFAIQLRGFPTPGADAVSLRDRIVLRDPAGTAMDTLIEMPSGRTVDFSGGAPRMRIFEAEPVWTLLSDGRLARGSNDAFRIEILSSDGHVERVLTRPFTRAPVTDADRTALRAMMRDAMLRQGAPPAAVDPLLQSLEFADTYPAFATLLGGPDGTLWVQRIRTPAEGRGDGAPLDPQDLGSPNWDVFDAEGRSLGTVAFPDGMTPMRFVGSHVYGTLRDEFDVPHVVRVRLDW